MGAGMGHCVTETAVEEMDARERCLTIDGMTPEGGLYTDVQRPVNAKSNSSWRVSPEPWWLPADLIAHFEMLGRNLYAFYRAANLLYSHSVRGIQPPWVAAYLDQGKPDEVIANGRMNRFKQRFPHVKSGMRNLLEQNHAASELTKFRRCDRTGGPAAGPSAEQDWQDLQDWQDWQAWWSAGTGDLADKNLILGGWGVHFSSPGHHLFG